MDIKAIEGPEGGSGPFDDLEKDDMDDNYRAVRPEDWDGPADEMDLEE